MPSLQLDQVQGLLMINVTCALLQGGTGADDGMAPGGPIRNVQSMHTFYPQPGPSGPPQGSHGQDGARPHSWDNSNANAQLNNLQNLLGSQQILQQIASLNQQQVLRTPAYMLRSAVSCTCVLPSASREYPVCICDSLEPLP